jgi:hypothetical protein
VIAPTIGLPKQAFLRRKGSLSALILAALGLLGVVYMMIPHPMLAHGAIRVSKSQALKILRSEDSRLKLDTVVNEQIGNKDCEGHSSFEHRLSRCEAEIGQLVGSSDGVVETATRLDRVLRENGWLTGNDAGLQALISRYPTYGLHGPDDLEYSRINQNVFNYDNVGSINGSDNRRLTMKYSKCSKYSDEPHVVNIDFYEHPERCRGRFKIYDDLLIRYLERLCSLGPAERIRDRGLPRLNFRLTRLPI